MADVGSRDNIESKTDVQSIRADMESAPTGSRTICGHYRCTRSSRRGRFHICPLPRQEPTPAVSVYPKPMSPLYEPVVPCCQMPNPADMVSGVKIESKTNVQSIRADMESAPTGSQPICGHYRCTRSSRRGRFHICPFPRQEPCRVLKKSCHL